jgi:hypothetical protein
MSDNVIDGFRHAVRCPFVLDRTAQCDCSPLDESKAMRGGDVLRIFAPLPHEEAEALRKYLGK